MPVVIPLLPSIAHRFILASDVLTKVRIILQDTDASALRSPDAEFFGWLDDAINTVLSLVPSLFSKISAHACTAGSRQQIAFERAAALLDVIGVPECDMATLTQFAPGWQGATAGAAQNWMREPGSPLSIRLYPPAPVGQALDVLWVESPAKITALTDVVPLPEAYEAALVEYVAGVAQLKEDESISFERQAALMASFAARIKGQ